MRHVRAVAWFILMLLLLPLMMLSSVGEQMIPNARAASCRTSDREPYWGVEAANITIEDDEYYDFGYYDEDAEYIEPSYYERPKKLPLGTLVEGDDFSVSQVMENDSAAGLRLNLTTGQRYQFCITAQHLYNGSIIGTTNVDVYLLTSYDWQRYEMDYSNRDSEWREFTDEIPVEWRGWMNSFYWMPYRDVHAYEDSSSTEFAVALDQPQVSTSMFSQQSDWEEFYLVVDGWDNMQSSDAAPPGHQVQVDIQVMIEQRTALPNWTVSIAFCGLLIGIAAIPAVLHVRYSRSGRETEGIDLIPAVTGTQEAAFGALGQEDETGIVEALHTSFDADDSGHLDSQELATMEKTLSEMGALPRAPPHAPDPVIQATPPTPAPDPTVAPAQQSEDELDL